jgi:mannose/fructose-specific phosphotransferase system component IIA
VADKAVIAVLELPILVAIVADKAVIALLAVPMLVAIVAERATAKSLTEVIRVLAVPMLVAIVADNATAKSLTDVIRVLAVPMLVAIVAERAVIAVLELPMLVAIVADRATAKSLTDVMRVFAVPILVAIVAERAATVEDVATLSAPIRIAVVALRVPTDTIPLNTADVPLTGPLNSAAAADIFVLNPPVAPVTAPEATKSDALTTPVKIAVVPLKAHWISTLERKSTWLAVRDVRLVPNPITVRELIVAASADKVATLIFVASIVVA